MARQQNQSDFKGGSDIAASELSDRIRSLESELDRLRKAQSKTKSKASLLLPDAHVLSLDLDLQRQVLMLTEAMPHMVWISDSEGKTTHANNRFY